MRTPFKSLLRGRMLTRVKISLVGLTRGVVAVLAVCCGRCGPCQLLCWGGHPVRVSFLSSNYTHKLLLVSGSQFVSGCVLPAILFFEVGCSPSPLHDIAIANIEWCMAYIRGVGEASYIAR